MATTITSNPQHILYQLPAMSQHSYDTAGGQYRGAGPGPAQQAQQAGPSHKNQYTLAPIPPFRGHSNSNPNTDTTSGSSSGAYPTPVTAQHSAVHSGHNGQISPSYRDPHSQYSPAPSGAGPSGQARQPVPRPVNQMDIDGMEYQARGLRIAAEDEGDGRAGVEDPCGERDYTEFKCLGDGSFGTVWLCDWHSPVRPGVLLSAMQCGAGARPEWAGKRLVALKRMKKVWDGGWKEAKTLGELVSLRRLPPHPAIIPLYDAFISPETRQLYFVFECMEGNLYQLTKSRRGRPLALGLIASCFHQMSSGLFHIHDHGYFHRDMKPENLLVTTTGLTSYLTTAGLKQLNTRGTSSGSDEPLPRTPDGVQEIQRYEKDVSVIVKLADFGLARATASKPPYTEYVSTRWYRAPEVLLRSREYGPPVDMWALGTILTEMVNLKPLFPGVSEIDQVYKICEVLGDPSPDYGVDDRGKTIGGGSWNTGIKLAKNVGFSFPKRTPVAFRSLFADRVPQSLIDCIAELLMYNPKYRLTSAQCLDHPYFHETLPDLQRQVPLPRIPFSQGQPSAPPPIRTPIERNELNVPPRQLPPSHSQSPHDPIRAFANGDMRTLPPPVPTADQTGMGTGVYFPQHGEGVDRGYGASALVNQLRELDLPTDDLASYGVRGPPSPSAINAQYSFDRAGREAGSGQPAHLQRNDRSYLLEEPVSQNRRPSNAQTLFDGSVYEGSQPAASQASFQDLLNNPPTPARMYQDHPPQSQSQNRAPSHVAAYVQQQRQMQHAPMDPSESMMPPPIEPTQGARPGPAIISPTIGKKKKWGLSAVFGGGDKSTHELATVSESGYGASTASLKRTQSGTHPPQPPPEMPVDSDLPPLPLDPKKAKKELEKRARDLEMAKREAAARAQKERARAVMQKKNMMVEKSISMGSERDEYGDITVPRTDSSLAKLSSSNKLGVSRSNLGKTASSASIQHIPPQQQQHPQQQQQQQHQSSSPNTSMPSATSAASLQAQRQSRHPHGPSASTPDFSPSGPNRTYASMPPSASLSSVRSLDSGHSQSTQGAGKGHHHGHGQGQALSSQALAAYELSGGASRNKARRRNDDDDHSMSSFDKNSLRSRSVLTVGTIDSDPGPRRARDYYPDPILSSEARRAPSMSNFKRHRSPSRLTSLSNPSLDSQLAQDFMSRASVASPNIPPVPALPANPSVTSLGRPDSHSQLHLNGLHHVHQGTYLAHNQHSLPTSPYGHPAALAVAHGVGTGRETVLPSIKSWEGDHGEINPMFRVPPAESNHGSKQGMTLPPFSTLASLADHNNPHAPRS